MLFVVLIWTLYSFIAYQIVKCAEALGVVIWMLALDPGIFSDVLYLSALQKRFAWPTFHVRNLLESNHKSLCTL